MRAMRKNVRFLRAACSGLHLVYRLPPFGYGKDVLRGKFRIHLSNSAISPAGMLRDEAMVLDTQVRVVATEAAASKKSIAGGSKMTPWT